jgi:phage FluMu gp28-like protein
MDSTGVGEPIYDDLQQRISNIEAFHFTENSRNDLLNNLKLLIEQRKIKIPNDEVLINELKSFQYQLTRTNKIRVGCPDNQHDDTVMSLALAVWNIPKEKINAEYNEQREILKQFDYFRKMQHKKDAKKKI